MTIDAFRIAELDILGIQIGALSTMCTARSEPLSGLLDVALPWDEGVGLSGADISLSTSVAL